MPLASRAVAGMTTLSPAAPAYLASWASEWSSGVRTLPPKGARITIGIGKRPCERKRIRATWPSIWWKAWLPKPRN